MVMEIIPSSVLDQIKALAIQEKVSFTYKALREIEALALGLDETDVCQLLTELKASDFVEMKKSNITEEWLYIFNLMVEGLKIYLKMILREDCVVISFHEDKPL